MDVYDLVGKSLGQYQVLSLLGSGGMASVYRAVHPTLHKEVAIKVLSQSVALVPGAMERFMREARTTAALDHPHIVTQSFPHQSRESPRSPLLNSLRYHRRHLLHMFFPPRLTGASTTLTKVSR